MLMGEVRAERLMQAIEPDILDSLTTDQVTAIRDAANTNLWDGHIIDIRFSFPFFFRRFYFAVVAGEERRSVARRNSDRNRYPLTKIGNILFFAGIVVATTLIALVSLLMVGGVVTP